jgi:DNA-binding IclR family transcriptional regulator
MPEPTAPVLGVGNTAADRVADAVLDREVAPVAPSSEAPSAAVGHANGDTAPTIQTVQRAALILAAFTPGRPYLSLNEITRRLGASKATAHRYTKALRAAKLLRYDERTALFSLGPQVLTLGAAARAGLPIVSAAEPFMEQLGQDLDETVVLSIWDGESPIVVRSVDNTDRVIRISVRVGARLDTMTSAQGRVFCAFLPTDDVPGLARAVKRDPALEKELATVRESGVSVNVPAVNGVRSIAAPVFQGRVLRGSIAVVGTTVSVPPDADGPLAAALKETATALSIHLGTEEAAPTAG